MCKMEKMRLCSLCASLGASPCVLAGLGFSIAAQRWLLLLLLRPPARPPACALPAQIQMCIQGQRGRLAPPGGPRPLFRIEKLEG